MKPYPDYLVELTSTEILNWNSLFFTAEYVPSSRFAQTNEGCCFNIKNQISRLRCEYRSLSHRRKLGNPVLSTPPLFFGVQPAQMLEITASWLRPRSDRGVYNSIKNWNCCYARGMSLMFFNWNVRLKNKINFLTDFLWG